MDMNFRSLAHAASKGLRRCFMSGTLQTGAGRNQAAPELEEQVPQPQTPQDSQKSRAILWSPVVAPVCQVGLALGVVFGGLVCDSSLRVWNWASSALNAEFTGLLDLCLPEVCASPLSRGTLALGLTQREGPACCIFFSNVHSVCGISEMEHGASYLSAVDVKGAGSVDTPQAPKQTFSQLSQRRLCQQQIRGFVSMKEPGCSFAMNTHTKTQRNRPEHLGRSLRRRRSSRGTSRGTGPLLAGVER